MSYCANPHCGRVSEYPRGGRLFQFNLRRLGAHATSDRTISFWWLCSECCLVASLTLDGDYRVKLVGLQRPIRNSPHPEQKHQHEEWIESSSAVVHKNATFGQSKAA